MKRLISTVVLCLSTLLLGACSTSMTGHVYVDANANKQVDAGEKGVQSVHYTVTQDGKIISDGYTDATGAYAIKVKGSGQYCVNLDKVSLQGQDPKFKPRLATSALLEGPIPTPPPIPKDPYVGNNQALPVTKDVPAATSPPPSDSYAKPAATASTGPAEGTVSLSNLSGCVQMGLSSQDVDVPIVPDYTATIDSIQAPQPKTLAPGDLLDYKLIGPASCNLVSSPIPDIFITTENTGDVTIASDASPMLDFSESVADGISPAKNLTQDGLATKVVHLRVRNNVLGDKTKYTLQQKVSCPDGNTYSLPGQEINIVSKPLVSVSQNLVGGYGLGLSPTDEVTIENNTPQTIVDIKLTVEFAGEVYETSSTDASCKSNLGVDVVCTFDLQASEKKVVKVKFTLPKSITITANSNKEEYSIGATLKIPSQTDAVTADKIHFYLSPSQ